MGTPSAASTCERVQRVWACAERGGVCVATGGGARRRVATLRDQLESGLLTIEEAFVNGSTTHRLPNVSNISFRCVEGEKLMATFNQKLAVSSGSACTSASLDPSHVLTAMGLSDEMAHSSIRFSLGRFNTAEDVNRAIELVKTGVEKLRKISPVWEMWKEGLLNDF